MQTTNDITMVTAGACEVCARPPLPTYGKRPGLTPRDRSIVTISALIARPTKRLKCPTISNLALDNGLKPREISEIITQLAFLPPGWANAMSAVVVAKDVFLPIVRLGPISFLPLRLCRFPLDKDTEAKRAAAVEQQFGKSRSGRRAVHH